MMTTTHAPIYKPVPLATGAGACAAPILSRKKGEVLERKCSVKHCIREDGRREEETRKVGELGFDTLFFVRELCIFFTSICTARWVSG